MAVTRMEIVRREPYEGGRGFGAGGPYERIDAVAHYAVDPEEAANAGIVDLDRAGRDDDGRVHFSGDATFLVPADPGRANRALLLEVPNRGNRIAMRSFNMAPFDLMPTDEIPPGDGFLLERGWCIAWCGWQWDVPHPSIRMGLRAPAVPPENRTPAGRMQLRIQPDRDADSFALTDHHVGAVGNHAPIPPLDPDEPGAELWVREHLFADPERIPRNRWTFAHRGAEPAASGSDRVALAGGFEAGKIYDLVYTPAECPVVGAGLLAVRDLAIFARHGEGSPAAGRIDHVIAEGVSQCGRFLRTLLHAGLNRDEAGRTAFDGVLVHVAGGRRGEFNHRYGQPSVQPTRASATASRSRTIRRPIPGRDAGPACSTGCGRPAACRRSSTPTRRRSTGEETLDSLTATSPPAPMWSRPRKSAAISSPERNTAPVCCPSWTRACSAAGAQTG